MRRLTAIFWGVIFFLAAGNATAQDPKADIRKLLTVMEERFNQGDAKGLAACWTPSGDFVNQSGDRFEGRANIEKAFQQSFSARKKCTMQARLLALRIVNDGLALVDVLPDVKPRPASQASDANLSLVLINRDGRWLIENARETRSAPLQVQHLKELEWLVGDWTGVVAPQSGVALRSTCGWTDSRAYLIRKFTVEGKNGVLHSGTEVIGWDPRARRIRSWTFDSDGGFGENVWVQDGNRWLIKYSGTLANGNDVSATHVIAIVDADTLKIQSKDRIADGQRQPDVPEVTLKRQKKTEAPSKTAEPQKPAQKILP
jgi:uncharacterized protein (TIGR02246 family)